MELLGKAKIKEPLHVFSGDLQTSSCSAFTVLSAMLCSGNKWITIPKQSAGSRFKPFAAVSLGTFELNSLKSGILGSLCLGISPAGPKHNIHQSTKVWGLEGAFIHLKT